VRTVALQLLAGLAFLHSHSIIHADVKPDNVLLAAERAPPAEDSSAFLQEGDDDVAGGLPAGATAAAAASAAADKLQLQELVLGEQWRGSCRAGLVVKLCDFGNVVHADQVKTNYRSAACVCNYCRGVCTNLSQLVFKASACSRINGAARHCAICCSSERSTIV
jgi:serine/threonine protein kinase